MPRYAYLSVVVCFISALAAAVALYVEKIAAADKVFQLAGALAVYLGGVHTNPPGGSGGT